MLGLESYGSDDEQDIPKISTPAVTKGLKRPVKFTVELPKSTESESDAQRPNKRPRSTGSGKSSLLGMLPAPSKPSAPSPAVPHISKQQETTNSSPPQFLSKPASSTPFNDFFSLNNTKSTLSTNTGKSTLPLISSAPSVSEFLPPEPTAEDEYPGYYRLPSGTWARYDPEYYHAFWQKKQDEWLVQHGAEVEKGFENAKEEAKEVSAEDQLNHAEKLREEKKNLTRSASSGPQKPNMNMEAPKGSRARYRHQLTALLSEAYEKREELEEKIAQARRNRKDAGNKYGF